MIEEDVSEPISHFFGRDSKAIRTGTIVNTIVRGTMKRYLDRRGFVEINPVIISPISDPLNHPVADPVVDYYGRKYRITKSMIFHKQLALTYLDKIYSFSPNIRIEPLERARTGRHLAEFTQLDLEVRDKPREYVMTLAEGMINKAIEDVMKKVDRKYLNPRLHVFPTPFRRIRYSDAFEKYGRKFEDELSSRSRSPFWIIDIPLSEREFYDREIGNSGYLRDMDLIYPYGYGEAISGGEREFEYDRIRERIRKKGQREEDFSLLLEASKIGLHPSSGFGIGIERLVRFIIGSSDISAVTLFPKTIGEFVL
ncbi:MAG: asparagine synthetase A [Thermoplasmatales archaeon]